MAIKREKKLIDYQTKIGVNRGAGIATAANNAAQQSEIFDRLLNREADANLNRLKKRGEKLGEERAAKTQFQTISTEIEVDGEKKIVNVPIRPPTPTGMGLTEAEVYEKNIVNLFNNRMKTDIDSEIISASLDAIDNNGTPDRFDMDVDARLKPYFDAMADGSHRELMKIYAQERKDIHGFKVWNKHKQNIESNARHIYTYQLKDATNYADLNYKHKKIKKEEILNIINIKALKQAGIDTTNIELDIDKMIIGYNLANDFWKQYPILNNANEVNLLNKLVAGKVDTITINNEKVTREDVNKYLENAQTREIIGNELKKLDIYNNEQYLETITRLGFDRDFDIGIKKVLDGKSYTSNIAGNPNDFEKLYIKNKHLYDEKIDKALKDNGFKGNPTEYDRFSILLKTTGFINPVIREQIISVIRQPSEKSLQALMPYLEEINKYGIENKEYRMKDMNLRQKRQLDSLVSLHKHTGGNALETATLFQELKDKFDSAGDINQILQTNITTNTAVNTRRDLLYEVERYVKEDKSLGVFSYDRDFVAEVMRDVEIQLMLGTIIDDDEDYPVIIQQAMNNVLGYGNTYSIDYTTAPQVSADETLMLDTDPIMQRTRVTKYGALKAYGVSDSMYDSKKDPEVHINYIHDHILKELQDADPLFFGGEIEKKAFIKKMKDLKGTKAFFYEDERTDIHIQLIPISGHYSRNDKPEYHIGVFDATDGSYRSTPAEGGYYLDITEEEFTEAKEKYEEKLKDNKHEAN